jgi:glyoxylate reductase
MRQFAKAEVACRNLEWKKNLPLARDPEQKTIGIVGMGGIGTVVARRMALGWGMRVLYHNRSKLAQEPTDFKVEYKSSLEELLAESDIVSLHIPVSYVYKRCLVTADYQMSAKTKNLFGKAQFEAMKQGSVLVNTAR